MRNSMVLESLKGFLLSLMLLMGAVALSQTFDNPDAEPEIMPDLEPNLTGTEDSVEVDQDPEQDLETEQEPEQIIVDASVIEQGDFNPFVPSEDISEDYSVPFPVDI